MKIAIIGAGHAGVAAALEASRLGAEVSLFSEEAVLPYYRPKITSVAFGQSEGEEILIHPQEWYDENKIKLITNCKVEKLDPKKYSLTTSDGRNLRFDKIIITSGACPIVPKFTEEAIQKGYTSTLWNIKDALLIRKNIKHIKKLVIIGGGVIGIECALRALDAGIEVSIIEKADNLMQKNLSLKGSEVLKRSLTDKGIEILTSTAVKNITQSNGKASIKTPTAHLQFDHIILSIGCMPNINFLKESGIHFDDGVCVNSNLESDTPGIYSGGDSASIKSISSLFSVLNAINQGKIAGHNAFSSTDSLVLQSLPASVDIKYNNFELHALGFSCESSPENEEVIEDNNSGVYRSILKDGDAVSGIQMIGSSKDLNLYKKQLTDRGSVL